MVRYTGSGHEQVTCGWIGWGGGWSMSLLSARFDTSEHSGCGQVRLERPIDLKAFPWPEEVNRPDAPPRTRRLVLDEVLGRLLVRLAEGTSDHARDNLGRVALPTTREGADTRAMTASHPSAAALATELAYLIDLPVEQRGDAEGARYDEVRWALADIDPADRMDAYAAAVAAIDPNHHLGPYPDPTATPLTHELYAFETWRVARFYSGEGPHSDLANRLLQVTDPIFHTYTPEQIFEYGHIRTLLVFREITADDFPDFSLRDFMRRRGTDLEAFDAVAGAFAKAAATLTDDPSTGP